MATNNLVALERIDRNYLSADDLMRNPDVLAEIMDVQNEKTFLNALNEIGRAKGSKTSDFYHYENGLSYRSVAVATVVAGAPTNEVTVTLSADSYTTVGSLTGSRDRSPLKATDLVIIPRAGAAALHAYVTAKSDPTPESGSAMNGVYGRSTPTGTATTYTLKLRNGDAADLRAALTAMVGDVAQRMTAYSNAHSEGSYQPLESMDAPSTRYRGDMQIWKSVKAITEEAVGEEFAINIGGGQKLVSRLRAENLVKHNADMGWAMMLSPGGTITNSAGEIIQLTKGFTSYVTESGVRVPYVEADGFALEDLTAITSAIKAVRGDSEYFFVLGSDLRPQVEAVLRSLTNGGGISYNAFGIGSNADRAIDLGFDSFKWNGITFHLIEEATFNHSEVTGLANLNYNKRGYLIPAGKQKIAEMNGLSMVTRDYYAIQLRYLEQNNLRFRDWTSTPETNGGRMVTTHNLYSMQGLQMMGLSKFLEVYPA